ncbi:MAG: hypothetical protein H0W50_05405 [Parachlamydiaceae bacterium]|nr:hypothetical protein [Parachlamydiaceae bacterium]
MNADYNKDFNIEISLLLNSKDPAKDLDVKNNKIVKKDIFSKFISLLVGSDKPSAALKNRIGEITQKLLTSKSNEGSDEKINFSAVKENLLKNVVKHKNKEKEDLVVALLCNRISSVYDSKDDKSILKRINTFKREHLKHALNQNEEYITAKQIKKSLITEISENPLSLEQKIELLEAKTSAKIVKMHLLQKMGEVGRSEKGTTGTALVFDYRKDGSERLIGVFKPDSSFSSLAVKITNIARRLFGQHSLMSHRPLAQPRAENVAYEAGKFFNLLSVPPSRLTEVGGIKGVFQLAAQTFVKTIEDEKFLTNDIKLHEADDLTQQDAVSTILNNPDKVVTESERNAFQEFALLDFLIGNLDGHGENWFIGLAKGEEGKVDQDIAHIVGIDKANSFPVANPGALGIGGKNQYLWKETELAKKPFTNIMREKMKLITPDKVKEFINMASNSQQGFFEDSMKDLFSQRAKAIRNIAEIEGSTPADLATMITDNDFVMGIEAKMQPPRA